MNPPASNQKTKSVHPGTLSLGKAHGITSDSSVFKAVFCCRKNGFDFIGQLRIDAPTRRLDIEMFNPGYFDMFSLETAQVKAALQTRVLSQVLQEKQLDPVSRNLVEQALQESRKRAHFKPRAEEPEVRADSRDLQFLVDQLNREYFSGKLTVNVEWGKNVKTPNHRSFRFGSYDARKNVIRIHPRLKQDFVPLSVLELTLYHEMCHKAVPPVKRNGQWQAHHADFKRKEREYRNYREAVQWEKRHWAKLLVPPAEAAV